MTIFLRFFIDSKILRNSIVGLYTRVGHSRGGIKASNFCRIEDYSLPVFSIKGYREHEKDWLVRWSISIWTILRVCTIKRRHVYQPCWKRLVGQVSVVLNELIAGHWHARFNSSSHSIVIVSAANDGGGDYQWCSWINGPLLYVQRMMDAVIGFLFWMSE